MRFSLSKRAESDYDQLGKSLRKLVDKQLNLLIKNLRHPSLRAKKYDEDDNVWQARVTKDYRFYFRIRDDIYEIVTIIKHLK